MYSTTNWSALGNCSPDEVSRSPYAHIVRNSVYPASVYDRLSETFPDEKLFLSHVPEVKNNQAVRICAADVIGNDLFSSDWQGYFSYHTSNEFWQDIVSVFGESLRKKYPDLEEVIGRPMHEWTAKRRGEIGEAEISLDLLFVINSAVKRASSVRPAHVDRRNKIFTGLLYMKQAQDPTPGGDLAMYRFKNGHMGFTGHYADLDHLEETNRIPYGSNTFIGFVNSDDSIHGVTPRPETPWVRRYINFVAELSFDAFDLPKLPLHQRLKGWMSRRKLKVSGIDIKLES